MAIKEKQTTAVGTVDQFSTGQFVIMEVGGRSVGIIRLNTGELRAVHNWCPHKGAPICRGIVGGTWPPSEPGELLYDRPGEVLACPWHGFEYDLNTGNEMFGTGPTRLRLFPVSVSDGQVYVTV